MLLPQKSKQGPTTNRPPYLIVLSTAVTMIPSIKIRAFSAFSQRTAPRTTSMGLDTAHLHIYGLEGYDMRRYAQSNWEQLKSVLDAIADCEEYPTGVILIEAT